MHMRTLKPRMQKPCFRPERRALSFVLLSLCSGAGRGEKRDRKTACALLDHDSAQEDREHGRYGADDKGDRYVSAQNAGCEEIEEQRGRAEREHDHAVDGGAVLFAEAVGREGCVDRGGASVREGEQADNCNIAYTADAYKQHGRRDGHHGEEAESLRSADPVGDDGHQYASGCVGYAGQRERESSCFGGKTSGNTKIENHGRRDVPRAVYKEDDEEYAKVEEAFDLYLDDAEFDELVDLPEDGSEDV